jgi:hypothetical protein
MEDLEEENAALGLSGVIKCTMKKLPAWYHVAYQMEGLEE